MASERTRSSIMARTTSRGIGCADARRRASGSARAAARPDAAGAMKVLASAPNPVDTP